MPASKMKRVFIESADCYVNLEKVSWPKKRFRCGNENEATFGRKVSGIEEHYFKFLETCQPSCDSEMEQVEYDPTYLSFLENLREHGNSYICDVPSDHGVRSPLKYEDNDEPSDELKRKTPKSRSYNLDIDLEIGVEKLGDTLSEKTRSLHLDVKKSDSRKTNTEMRSPNIVEKLSASWQKSHVSKHNGEVGCSSSQDHRSNSKAHIVDSSYKVFRSGFKVSEQSFLYKYGDNTQVYHEGSDQHKAKNVQNKPSKTVDTTKIPTSRPITLTPTSPTLNPAPIPRAPTPNDCHNVSVEPLKSSCRTQIPTPTPTPRAPTSSPTSSTLSKTVQKLRDDYKKSRAVFRKKLEICCRRPYERKECKDLWRKVNARKPITIHMETRGREYAKEGGMGKSYLDTHLGLREEIKKVHSDPYKVLNLLRGFFLYLQCIPSGIQPPWKVDDLMKIMVGST